MDELIVVEPVEPPESDRALSEEEFKLMFAEKQKVLGYREASVRFVREDGTCGFRREAYAVKNVDDATKLIATLRSVIPRMEFVTKVKDCPNKNDVAWH